MLQYGAVVAAITIALGTALIYLLRKPSFPSTAPPRAQDTRPILGSFSFFTNRWEFFRRSKHASPSGHFSFCAGQWPVVALTGEHGRKVFFEEKTFGLAEGYGTLLGGAPTVQGDEAILEGAHGGDASFNSYFNKRVAAMVRTPRLAQNLPKILRDARTMFDRLAADPAKQTDVFESVYSMVFRFTMRTVACDEIADNEVLLAKTQRLFEDLDATATPMSIAFPWLPTVAKAKRFYCGAQLFRIFSGVIKDREKTGRRHDDPLQYLLDEGDKTVDILTFVLGGLFAGQVNSGVNSAYVVLQLATSPSWLGQVWKEVNAVADRHTSDQSLPLRDRLMQIPLEAWENEFPVVDLCLKETIRLYMVGTCFRQNTSSKDIPIDKEGKQVVPAKAYVAYALGDAHYDSSIYEDPDVWDPGRFLPERAEARKQTYGYIGWGVARHPCLGMRFAKIENNIIVAFMLAYFENFRVVDGKERKIERIPLADRNGSSAHKPKKRIYLQYDVRAEPDHGA